MSLLYLYMTALLMPSRELTGEHLHITFCPLMGEGVANAQHFITGGGGVKLLIML